MLPKNYRPISLANTVLKLFTLLISNRLLIWTEKYKIISEYQAAYKRNVGCADHVFVLTAAIQYNIFKGKPIYGLFVDMSQAFDTIDHKRLWTKLEKLGVSSKIINTMEAIYKIAKAKVRTNYDISESFPILKGVLQGETVSPILWNLYMEDLIPKLYASGTIPIRLKDADLHALLYADDIVILAYTEGELQKKINVLKTYLTENRLRVNLTKTQYMIFSKRKIKQNLQLNWGGNKIERAKVYAYLGVPFNESLNFTLVKNHFFLKTKKAMADLHSVIYKSKMNNFNSILCLYNSLIRSVASYCAPIWGVKFSAEFEFLRIKFLKSLFLLPKLTPHWFVRLELDIRTSEIIFLKSVLKFIFRICEKNKDSLVYKAFATAKLIRDDNKSWFGMVKNLCRKWDCTELLGLHDSDLPLTLKNRILNNKLCIIENNTICTDISNMRDSNFFRLYNQNKTHCLNENYLYEDYIWKAKQLILQLKLGISCVTFKGKVTRIRYLEKLYNNIDDDTCLLCGKETEDVFHIMFTCIHYKTERKMYIMSMEKYSPSLSKLNYVLIFNNLNKSDALKLLYFFNCASQRRNIYLSEISASENTN